MPFQKKIEIGIPQALPGTPASSEPQRYAGNRLAGPGIRIGRFVFAAPPGVENRDFVYPSAPAEGTSPIGFVRYQLTYYDTDIASPGTMNIREGSEVAVAVSGDFWAEVPETAAEGDWVFASETDGTIKTAAGFDSAIEGYVATSWRITETGENGLAVISNGVGALALKTVGE